VGLIFLANVPRLWSVLTLNMIVKNYVAEEKYVCVCKRERERDHKFFTSLRSMKVLCVCVCVWMKVNQDPC
jgi:methylphosphotriester-DNA--protein-cysteine methyltransferase